MENLIRVLSFVEQNDVFGVIEGLVTRLWKEVLGVEIDHAQHPVGRAGTPEDVAHLAVYLLSPRSAFVTGQNFIIDGGMTRKMIYA